MIAKDDPKAAIFIASRLFNDFACLAHNKIESTLSLKTKDKSLFKCLSRTDDPTYDQILEALGSISEFCLPSLLKILIEWYHHQLGNDTNTGQRRPHSFSENFQSSLSGLDNQYSDCGSPSHGDGSISLASANTSINYTINNNISSALSPTPSSPDITSQNLQFTSNQSIETHPPQTTTQIIPDSNTSNVNTSTSTATNASFNSLTDESNNQTVTNRPRKTNIYNDRRLLIEYASCQALLEIFSQIYLHPGYDDLVIQIEDLAFEHFRYVDVSNELCTSDIANINQLVDIYAQVIGVLVRTRFKEVKKRFMTELNKLRTKEQNQYNIQCIVTLIAGMKYFRVKMAPIEDFESCMQFLQELAEYFLEVRHKSIRHALAGLFVEIMIPLASTVKNEVKIPCLKNLVDTLWSQTLDMCSRKKHSITLIPLVTCLLCVSQRSFFLANWGVFLNMCLSNLKNRDQKMCRVALESLYRLIWIYMIRVKCESNNITQTRLHSIVDALFPKNSRSIVPRDIPLTVFVDIIHFIAQERLDFSMRHIIFDLLSVDRPFKVIIAPERMNIAIQAFLVISNGLQHKDSEPPLPKHIVTSNGTSSRTNINGLQSKQFPLNRMLNEETVKSMGLNPYYNVIQKSFNDILKALDSQFGRPLLLTTTLNTNKEPDDMITSERRPKIELLRTCVAAIPRLLPDGMSKSELVEFLSRMTIHVDETMQKLAFESLKTLITELPDWRLDAVEGFTLFLINHMINHIDESMKQLVNNALRMLLQFLVCWKGAIAVNSSSMSNYQTASPPGYGGVGPNHTNSTVRSTTISIQTGYESISSRHHGPVGQIAARKSRALAEMRLIQSELSNTPFHRLVTVLQKVEGASLVMMCSCHQSTRRLASHLLAESRTIINSYSAWTRIEQFGFRSPDEVDDEDSSLSLKGSLSADNLSRITSISASVPVHNSITSMNTQSLLTKSASKMCIPSNKNSIAGVIQSANQHDPYDTDIENHLADTFTDDDNLMLTFWLAVLLLESEKEQEYTFALRLLKTILPNLPFELPEFVEELEASLSAMNWQDFPGIHALILRGCTCESTYDISIALLDMLTPILKLPICAGLQRSPTDEQTSAPSASTFPFHVIILSTHLLSNYDDPSSFSLNIARRIAIWCEENSLKQLENLSTVMNLYSRRSFSKDAFQWTKCVVKYLFDVYPSILPQAIPLLVKLLECGPIKIQLLIAPILYCILNYVDLASGNHVQDVNRDLLRIYSKYLGSDQWREAVQIFKLIISRSSTLATNTSHSRELPGRTMDFGMDIESMPLISGRARPVESEHPPAESADATGTKSADLTGSRVSSAMADVSARQQREQEQSPSALAVDVSVFGDNVASKESLRSWLANPIVRQRLAVLLGAQVKWAPNTESHS